LSPVASKQLGLVTRDQAHEARVGNETLRRLVIGGVLQRVTPRVFRLTSSTPTWHQRVLAACLDGGDECYASHRTAAALHHLDGFSPGGIIEVVVPMAVRHRRLDVIVHHTRALPACDRQRVGSIRTTSVARTLIDLGAVLPGTYVEEALDSAERDQKVSRRQIEARYQALRAPGRNGIGAMTQILDQRLAIERIPWSVLERRVRRLLAAADLPQPTSRFKLALPDGSVAEIDFAFAPIPLGFEVDGNIAHATPRQRAKDTVRANSLNNLGWELRRFTYEQVVEEPSYVADVLRRALEVAKSRL
jgi:hypothetical protein